MARSIAGLARDIGALHEEGRVHCDVKPGNALLTGIGPTSIDPLGVATGELSPGATPGWAAPEQVLARPVSPATDVYALGLMVASLVGAAIYGEERSFVIPTGAGGRRRLRLLASPDVFIDPRAGGGDDDDGPSVPALTRAAWCDFIRRCVGFEPERRPENAVAFAGELDALIADAELDGDLPIRGGPGLLRRNVEVLGAVRPSWVITDTY
jgi:serine/threonine protein kinase